MFREIENESANVLSKSLNTFCAVRTCYFVNPTFVSQRDFGVATSHLVICCVDSCCSRVGTDPFKLSAEEGFSVGGCVVPPGTAAMSQTGGEERERTSERERATEGGKREERREGNRQHGQRRRLAVLRLSVQHTGPIKWVPRVCLLSCAVQLH